jgi:RHS repeat-associated protein
VLANGNRLVTRNGVALTYDAAGNLLADQAIVGGMLVNRSFTYTLAGQLKTVSVNGTLRATYFYNHLSQRTRKALASPPAGTPAITLYRYDPNGRLVEEIAGSAASAVGISVTAGQSLVTYLWLDETPSAIVHAGNSLANPGNASERVIYLHTDHLETPRKASDANARIVWSWEADAFGAAAPNEDVDGDGKATTVNLRFPGQFFDAESGLHYNWHRYNDARSGRYVQSDPIGLKGGINTYSYVDGNPVSYTDPEGLQSTPAPSRLPIWVPGGSPAQPQPRPLYPDLPGSPTYTPQYTPVPTSPSVLCQAFPLACAAIVIPQVVCKENDTDCEAERLHCAILCADMVEDGSGRRGGSRGRVFGGSIAQCIKNCLPERCGGEPKWKGRRARER